MRSGHRLAGLVAALVLATSAVVWAAGVPTPRDGTAALAGTWTLAASSPDGLVQTVDDKPIDGEGAKTRPTDPPPLPTQPLPLPPAFEPPNLVFGVTPPADVVLLEAAEALAAGKERPTTFATDALVHELTTPPERLIVAFEGTVVVVEDETGHTMRFSTTGKEEKHQFVHGTVVSKTKWDGAVLRQNFDAGGGLKYSESWTLDRSGQHLVVAQEAGVDTALHFGLPFVPKKAVAGVAGSAAWNYVRADR
jgi:hypothetical protein